MLIRSEHCESCGRALGGCCAVVGSVKIGDLWARVGQGVGRVLGRALGVCWAGHWAGVGRPMSGCWAGAISKRGLLNFPFLTFA